MNSNFSLAIRTIVIIVLAFVIWANLPTVACQAVPPTDLQPPKTTVEGGLSEASVAAGWISLFDGESLFGFKSESEVDWKVVDGAIVATAGRVGLLRTTSQFSDFHLTLAFRAAPNTNSGVFVRTSPKPKKVTTDCFEVNIAPPSNPFPTGGIVGRQKASISVAEHDGDWEHLRIVCLGDCVKVWVNGNQVNELESKNPSRGFIGLQFNKGSIAFKDVFLRPLDLSPMFNRENLDGWDDSQKGVSSFEVTESGDLKMTSGRGQLESKKLLGDFVLQANCKTNAAGLNSGIFFRSIPGDLTNGYESQIQNQIRDGDPTKPVDCGTGGIFRRQDARRVNAEDMKWFTKTIVAVGPHVSVWVNGYQVTDWTDKRKPHANPRKGLRLEAGSIILQGHDPTTDILFGEIDAGELAPRRK